MSASAKALVAVLTVLALGALLGMCGRVSDRGRFALSYSTYGAGPEGTRAAFELARAEGFDVRRWNEDVAELPAPATLVAIGGCDHLQSRPLSRPEREALLRWIDAGGTWIVAGATELLDDASFDVRLRVADATRCSEDDGLYGMIVRADRHAREHAARDASQDAGPGDGGPPEGSPPDAGVPVVSDDPDAGVELGTAVGDQWDKPTPDEDPMAALSRTLGGGDAVAREWATAEGALAGMPSVGLRLPGFVEIDDGVPHEVLARAAGKAAIVVVPHGQGRIVVITSGSAFQNRDLVLAEGAPLFVRLLRLYARGPVLFDEYHLGAGEARSTMRYLFQRGAAPLVIHLLIILAIVLVRSGRRFGAPRRDRPVEVVTTASFVSAIGALFAKVRDPRGSFRILARRAYARIADHHHVEELDPAKLEEVLRARKREHAADAVRDIARLAKDGKSDSLADATRQLDALTERAMTDGA
ncbi:MAG: DUF4350 domain-containing protein [Sandaracinus sp.]